MARHVIEALGKTRVVVEDGKVVEVGEPMVRYCPLFAKHRGIIEITPDVVRENIEFRIKDFGMCTAHRRMRMRDFLSFGVSELLGMALSKKNAGLRRVGVRGGWDGGGGRPGAGAGHRGQGVWDPGDRPHTGGVGRHR